MSWERLGEEVRHRRKLLRLTQAEVTERGGPSVATVRAIETNRAGRLSRRSRRALERAIEWDVGSVDAVLEGADPRPLGTVETVSGGPAAQSMAAAAERFAMAERVVKMKRAFASHRDNIGEPAREALEEEITRSARETEEAIIKMMPWLGDEDRGVAIRILAELRAE